jgi:hypothetical protein
MRRVLLFVGAFGVLLDIRATGCKPQQLKHKIQLTHIGNQHKIHRNPKSIQKKATTSERRAYY